MGHVIDPNNYRKIMEKDQVWGEEQFEKAAPWLKIVSEDPEKVPARDFRQVQQELTETIK